MAYRCEEVGTKRPGFACALCEDISYGASLKHARLRNRRHLQQTHPFEFALLTVLPYRIDLRRD